MELRGIVKSQAVRFIRAYSPSGAVYRPDVIDQVQEKYRFVHVKSPTNERGWNWNDSLIFEHGQFENGTIDEFRVHNEGVVVNTRASVEVADSFIDNVLTWFLETYGYVVKEYPPVERFFASFLEVKIYHDVAGFIKNLTLISRLINRKLEAYETRVGEFVPTGLSLNFDTSSFKGNAATGQFTVERKNNCPFDQNLYVSAAPLKTGDHIELLETFEELLGRTA